MSAAILYYHRVADVVRDPLLLAVSPDNFARHLEILGKRHTVLPLEELYDACKTNVSESLVALTFDDGYADNLLVAAPMLEHAGMCAALFAATGPCLSGEPFWWDELEVMMFSGVFDDSIVVELKKKHTFQLGESASWGESRLSQYDGWNVLRKDDPTPRHRAYRELFGLMQPLNHEEKRAVLEQLRAQQEADVGVDALQKPLTPEQLQEAHSSERLSVGSHTVHHPILSKTPSRIAVAEVRESKSVLERLLGGPQRLFSYPYGRCADINDSVRAAVADAGFEFACTTIPGLVNEDVDPLLLPRFGVRDMGATDFAAHLEACLGWGSTGATS